MNINELRTMQNYPLELKILKTKQRIIEWVSEYGVEGVYVAFSGGIRSREDAIKYLNLGAERIGTSRVL